MIIAVELPVGKPWLPDVVAFAAVLVADAVLGVVAAPEAVLMT